MPVPEERTCGECTLCCVVMSVPSLNKPYDKLCKHLILKSNKPCSIYEERPPECREFQCGYLKGMMGTQDRPDKTNAFITPSAKPNTLNIHVAPYREPNKRLKRFMEWLTTKRGITIILTSAGKARNDSRVETPKQDDREVPHSS